MGGNLWRIVFCLKERREMIPNCETGLHAPFERTRRPWGKLNASWALTSLPVAPDEPFVRKSRRWLSPCRDYAYSA